MSALGMASLGTQCTNKALGMASLGLFCGIVAPHTLDVQDGLHAHFADACNLSTSYTLTIQDSWHAHIGEHAFVYDEQAIVIPPDLSLVGAEDRWVQVGLEPRDSAVETESRVASSEEAIQLFSVRYEERWITVTTEHRLTFVDAEVRVLQIPDDTC